MDPPRWPGERFLGTEARRAHVTLGMASPGGASQNGQATHKAVEGRGSNPPASRREEAQATNRGSTTTGAVAPRRHGREDPESAAVPRRFCCPITGLLMRDPVLIETGQTYERAAVQAWFTRQVGFVLLVPGTPFAALPFMHSLSGCCPPGQRS
mgnify:CR=1 FL=1